MAYGADDGKNFCGHVSGCEHDAESEQWLTRLHRRTTSKPCRGDWRYAPRAYRSAHQERADARRSNGVPPASLRDFPFPKGVEKESNSCRPPHQVVRNRIRGEIENDPRQKHRRNSSRCEVCRPGDPQGETPGQSSTNLQDVAYRDREAGKDFSFCGRGRTQGFTFNDGHLRSAILPRASRIRLVIQSDLKRP